MNAQTPITAIRSTHLLHEFIVHVKCRIPESLKLITANLQKPREEVNAMLYDPEEANNETVETYTRVVSESGSNNKKSYGIKKRKFKNKKHTKRRKKTRRDIRAMKTESNKKIHKEPTPRNVRFDFVGFTRYKGRVRGAVPAFAPKKTGSGPGIVTIISLWWR